MGVESIVITHNPVTAWENFNLTAVKPGRAFAPAIFTDYSAVDNAEGGKWSCKFTLHGPEITLREMFESGLDRLVQAWSEGLENDFEGMIWSMELTVPPDKYRISMDSVVNEMFMRTDYDADGVVERSTTLQDTESQTRFGTIVQVLSGGEMPSLGVADQAVQAILDLKSFPRPEANFGGARGANEVTLDVFCRGIFHTLARQVYNQTASTGTVALSSLIPTIIDSKGDYVARKEISTNTTLVSEEFDADRTPFDIIREIVKVGDSNNNRWIARMRGPRCTDAEGRLFILAQASPAVKPA